MGAGTSILEEVEIAPGGTRAYTFGPAGHLQELSASSNVIAVSNDEAGQIERFHRSLGAGPALGIADITYDGRGFLRQAASVQTPIFSDGFETGDLSCWDSSVTFGPQFGDTNPEGACAPPTPEGPAVEALYDSAGLLHRVVSTDPEAGSLSRYVFYFAGRPIGQVTVDGANETWYLLTTDHLGAPAAGTTTGGALAWQGMLQPFGEVHGDLTTFLRLPGQWTNTAWADASSGLNPYYNVHRWYEWGTGRYTRSDPANLSLLVRGNDVRRTAREQVALRIPHPYVYAESNPLVRRRRSLRSSCERCVG